MTADLQPLPERVVILLFGNGAIKRTNDYAWQMARRGVRVQAVVADGQGWRRAPFLHPSVEVYSLAKPENRQPLLWLYEALVERAPAAVLRRLEGRLPGAGFARRAHRKAAGFCRRNVFWKVYRPFRHQALRAIALRRLGRLDLGAADHVVCPDPAAVPLAWSIARRHPRPVVTRALHYGPYKPYPVVNPIEPWDPDAAEAPHREPYTPL
ncbi:hypothetical protein [Glycomyces algeriensis]|uniref:Uncharacterized protein n=1 Tax=Glycomyces algeriensis TaxID=256037 RepID=A0A9W6G7G0_9ACTN|nr:hypothetical protein [Glycomyces algeriensis]MDA1366198.1 hypothetical protein [Glycomyces algeriensis]MDR7349034.1 hypothetical protein [Glycomyces algeriensis]GLI41737.1 hypothetical protein GALLR39Z86_15870 [Glycomyces algeriensis]